MVVGRAGKKKMQCEVGDRIEVSESGAKIFIRVI